MTMLHITLLCSFAFCAGMIDAAVGGGGLIQIPALINVLTAAPDATIFGTNKFSSVWGTSVAARSYVGKVAIPWKLVLPAAISAFAMSFLGAATVSHIPPGVLRPMVLWLVVVMAIYIFRKKDFGAIQRPLEIGTRERVLSVLIGGAIGFYDGLFGPGTGSFLIFLFIHYLALDFLQASASAKFKEPLIESRMAAHSALRGRRHDTVGVSLWRGNAAYAPPPAIGRSAVTCRRG
ncbi:MAG: sulfite exporter TauE/SafE family protein [Gallionella sp.]